MKSQTSTEQLIKKEEELNRGESVLLISIPDQITLNLTMHHHTDCGWGRFSALAKKNEKKGNADGNGNGKHTP